MFRISNIDETFEFQIISITTKTYRVRCLWMPIFRRSWRIPRYARNSKVVGLGRSLWELRLLGTRRCISTAESGLVLTSNWLRSICSPRCIFADKFCSRWARQLSGIKGTSTRLATGRRFGSTDRFCMRWGDIHNFGALRNILTCGGCGRGRLRRRRNVEAFSIAKIHSTDRFL